MRVHVPVRSLLLWHGPDRFLHIQRVLFRVNGLDSDMRSRVHGMHTYFYVMHDR